MNTKKNKRATTKCKRAKRRREDETIKIRIVIGTVYGGEYIVPEVGSSIPMTVERAIDAAWESVLGADLAGNGIELHVVDVELPMPIDPDPTVSTAKSVAKAARVDSKDVILRGRQQALDHVLEICKLDDEAIQRIKRVNVDGDFREDH